MKIIGLICLLLGIVGGIRSVTTDPPPHRSEAYKTGYRAGGVLGTAFFTGVGLWLLLRDGTRTARPLPSRPARPPGLPPQPMPSAPTPIPVKIHCGCGQNYSFDVEPVGGRMPAPVACPVCGADGTETANAFIAGSLAARAETSAWPSAPASGRRRGLHPVLIAGMAVVGLIVLAVAFRVVTRINFLRSSGKPDRPGSAERSWIRPNTSPTPGGHSNSRANPPTGAAGERNLERAGRPGSARDAAPVPPDATLVEVFWGNRWWPATILRRDGQRAFIHYDGWNSASDEWVTPDRLRPRR